FLFITRATTSIHTLSLHDALPIFLQFFLNRNNSNNTLWRNNNTISKSLKHWISRTIIYQNIKLSRITVFLTFSHFIIQSSLYCRSEEHTSELQSRFDLVCRLLLEK